MRVLIVNTSERTGGAAVAANRLLEALNNNGVKAKMLVSEKVSDKLTVASCGTPWQNQWNFLWERFVIWVRNGFSRQNLFKVSIANTGVDITKTKEFREADIIHLHWINQGFLSIKGIRRILDSGKPVVWTMHDMWPLTGICHHAYTCDNYQTACHDCPFLRCPGSHDLSYRVFNKKLDRLSSQRITYVTVSNWLAEKARHSMLTRHQDIEIVPNAIALQHFHLYDRSEARQTLGITEPHVIVFGAARIDDDIKGFGYLTKALQLLIDSKGTDRSDLRLLLFGGIKDERILGSIPVAYTYMGYVKDEQQLSQIYAASDCVVSSSLYETFGQTLIEAMACGCLPVAFTGSGQQDIISHQQNGYLADYLSAESLADGISWALTADVPVKVLRSNVQQRYSEDVVAKKYIEVYEQAMRPKMLKANI